MVCRCLSFSNIFNRGIQRKLICTMHTLSIDDCRVNISLINDGVTTLLAKDPEKWQMISTSPRPAGMLYFLVGIGPRLLSLRCIIHELFQEVRNVVTLTECSNMLQPPSSSVSDTNFPHKPLRQMRPFDAESGHGEKEESDVKRGNLSANQVRIPEASLQSSRLK